MRHAGVPVGVEKAALLETFAYDALGEMILPGA